MADVAAGDISLAEFNAVLFLNIEDAADKVALVEDAHLYLSVGAQERCCHDVEYRLMQEVIPFVLEE